MDPSPRRVLPPIISTRPGIIWTVVNRSALLPASRMRVANEEHGHVALPKLYGAPAYARPPVEPVVKTERPVDPDDLPLESEQTEEERMLARGIAAGSDGNGSSGDRGQGASGGRGRGRSFGLRTITQRVRIGNGARADS
jgi:hypothetical protein